MSCMSNGAVRTYKRKVREMGRTPFDMLQELREAGFTAKDVAHALGLTQQAVSRWEAGSRVHSKNLAALARLHSLYGKPRKQRDDKAVPNCDQASRQPSDSRDDVGV